MTTPHPPKERAMTEGIEAEPLSYQPESLLDMNCPMHGNIGQDSMMISGFAGDSKDYYCMRCLKAKLADIRCESMV